MRDAERQSSHGGSSSSAGGLATGGAGAEPPSRVARGYRDLVARLSQAVPEGSQLRRALQRLLDALVRGAATGLGIRGGLNALSLLFALLSRAGRRRKWSAPTLLSMARDSLRFGAFLGAFSAAAVGADEAIAASLGRAETARWRALASGLLAGPALLLAGPEPHPSVACYLLVRAGMLMVRVGNGPGSPAWVRALLWPSRLAHADVGAFSVAVAQVLYSFFVAPETLPKSYVRFLARQSGKPGWVLDGIRELCARNAGGSRPYRGPLEALRGTRGEGRDVALPCDFLGSGCGALGAGHACATHALAQVPGAFLRAVPVYLPVYLVPAFLLHRGRLLSPRHAPGLLGKVVAGALRSSGFLAALFGLAWSGGCAGWRLLGARGPVLAGTASLSGLSVLVEKKSRRVELAMYALARAVESFALVLDRQGLLPRWLLRSRVDVLAFSVASAAILHCYSGSLGAHRGTFRGKYLSVFDFILGNQGVDCGSISHVPSSQQLAGRAVRRIASTPAVQLLARAASSPFLGPPRRTSPAASAASGTEGEGGGEGECGGGREGEGGGGREGGGGGAPGGPGASRLSVSAKESLARAGPAE